MIQMSRIVDAAHWSLSDDLGERKVHLLDVPKPSVLIDTVVSEAESASKNGRIPLVWEPCCDSPGYFRVAAQIPLEETTFDQFFNGRSGYRAQYYLSPEEGILFNRELICTLEPALKHAYRFQPLEVDWDLVQLSLETQHSKIWVFNDQSAFDDAAPETLNPARWVKSGAMRGRRAPLPDHHMIDVKGAFIRPRTLDFFIDECKVDRACDLFTKGFS